jgi:hypothetical protein
MKKENKLAVGIALGVGIGTSLMQKGTNKNNHKS